MRRRLWMWLMCTVSSFAFAPNTGPCDSYRVGQLAIPLPNVVAQQLGLIPAYET
jgi:hypothetical protein